MILEIAEDVFDSPDVPKVGDLLGYVAEERHDWRPTVEVADAAERYVTTNFPTYGAFRDLVEKCLTETVTSRANPHASRVTVQAQHLRALVEDLGRPAVVVVEDRFSDGRFVVGLARALGHDRIVQAYQHRWLMLFHAGGVTRISKFVEDERAAFHLLTRVAAVVDSDRKIPHQRTGAYAQREKTAAQVREQGCEVHVWQYRTVENYVPTAAWRHHFPRQRDKITALAEMPPRQRGYLHIRSGLEKDKQCASGESVADELPDQVRHQWWKGLGTVDGDLLPAELELSEEDFAELGEEAVAELRHVLAMVEQIL